MPPIATIAEFAPNEGQGPTEGILRTALRNPNGSGSLEHLNVEGSEETRLNADVTVYTVIVVTGQRRAF